MSWSDKEFCIKCDGGGMVLLCSNSSCPLSVHEKCLGFSAKFDEMGRFYCPYCVYRQLAEEMHLAQERTLSRKRALLSFLDKKLINEDCQTQEFRNNSSKEPPRFLDDEDHLKGVSVPEDTLLEKVDQQQDRFAAGCSKSVLQSQDSDESSSCKRYDDVAGATECNHGNVVAGHQRVSACYEDNVGYESEDIDDAAERFEMVKTSNSIPPQPHLKQDVHQPRKTVENHIEDDNSVDSLVTEKKGGESILEAEKVDNDARAAKETVCNVKGTEEVEEQVHKIAALPQGDLAGQGKVSKKRRSKAGRSTRTESETELNGKRGKYNDENINKSTNGNGTSHNSASAPRVCLDDLDKFVSANEPKKLTVPASTMVFSEGRRKNLPWTDEEVNMLKEGVEKISNDKSTYISWKKILEFGRHVFHGTRTPKDLCGKWENINGRERYSRKWRKL